MKVIQVIASLDDPTLRLLPAAPEGYEYVIGNTVELHQSKATNAEVMLNFNGNAALLSAIWRISPNLKWIHSRSAGVEKLLFPELVESSIPLTNAKHAFSRSLGEYFVAASLWFLKDFNRMRRSQADRKWDPFVVRELHGLCVGIIGYGSIGAAVAKFAKNGFNMKVLGVKRTIPQEQDPLVDQFCPVSEMKTVFEQADIIVVCTPLTPDTVGLVRAEHLNSMKRDAILINVARGPVIQEEPLIEVLREKRILGAALDVFNIEPLPFDHVFYSMDNVLLSPHCADMTPSYYEDATKQFEANLQHWIRGEPLINLVDKRAGY
eukprot:GILJ01003089.1.p1 GENE.GILJ01003089.1~~GILJ01003089.1.p1  ORF type:complete len:334 (-),score=36.29 GILJ01003089.1:260-1222(-)